MPNPSIDISDLTGGRNGFDPVLTIPDDQAKDMVNVDLWSGALGNKRQGATALGVTFSSGGPFAGPIGSLIRHVPGDDETAAELWAIDTGSAARFGRLAAATTWTEATLKDNMAAAANGFNVFGASLGGMLFLAYKNLGGNRLHVWDPNLGTPKVRRVGIGTPNSATGASIGGGALGFTRFYRVRDVLLNGTDVRVRSEASASVSVTIAASSGVRITKGAATNEDETHWELEAADAAAGPWYRIARTVIGTTTFDDTSATISTVDLSPSTGINNPPPSAKFILATDARIIMANGWETSGGYVTPKNNRIWFTPVIGDNDVGDLERIPTGRYLDVDAAITGLGGPIKGIIYVFSYRQIWRLVPTGDATSPYVKFAETPGIGCITQKSIITAEDENGSPCLYFLSHRGPYRIGANGMQYLGSDVEDIWNDSPVINLAASNSVANGLYHAVKHQVWWNIATGSSDTPNVRIVFDTRLGRTMAADSIRKGWVQHTGSSVNSFASVMFANTVGATMSRDLKPYIAQSGTARIWKCDSSATDDGGTAFQAYIDTKEYAPVGLNQNCELDEPHLIAEVASGVTITVTASTDFGLRTTDGIGTCLLTAAGSETAVHKKIEGFQTSGISTVSYRIGDASAVSNHWTLLALLAPYKQSEVR